MSNADEYKKNLNAQIDAAAANFGAGEGVVENKFRERYDAALRKQYLQENKGAPAPDSNKLLEFANTKNKDGKLWSEVTRDAVAADLKAQVDAQVTTDKTTRDGTKMDPGFMQGIIQNAMAGDYFGAILSFLSFLEPVKDFMAGATDYIGSQASALFDKNAKTVSWREAQDGIQKGKKLDNAIRSAAKIFGVAGNEDGMNELAGAMTTPATAPVSTTVTAPPPPEEKPEEKEAEAPVVNTPRADLGTGLPAPLPQGAPLPPAREVAPLPRPR